MYDTRGTTEHTLKTRIKAGCMPTYKRSACGSNTIKINFPVRQNLFYYCTLFIFFNKYLNLEYTGSVLGKPCTIRMQRFEHNCRALACTRYLCVEHNCRALACTRYLCLPVKITHLFSCILITNHTVPEYSISNSS